MNSVGVMVCILGASLGVLTYVYFAGYFIEYFGHEYLLYIMTVGVGFILVTFAFMEGTVWWKNRHHKSVTIETSATTNTTVDEKAESMRMIEKKVWGQAKVFFTN